MDYINQVSLNFNSIEEFFITINFLIFIKYLMCFYCGYKFFELLELVYTLYQLKKTKKILLAQYQQNLHKYVTLRNENYDYLLSLTSNVQSQIDFCRQNYQYLNYVQRLDLEYNQSIVDEVRVNIIKELVSGIDI